jgi:membrane-bound metal-dependent hydrolase YbcI (DUF457 family)
VASPVAHSFAGLWIFLAAGSRLRVLGSRYRCFLVLGMLVFVANLPDCDFLISLVFRHDLNVLHRGFTHSFTMAAVAALVLAFIWRIATTFWGSFAAYFAAYSSHLLIDLCTGNYLGWTNSGTGIPLFWPSHAEYSSPLILIIGVRHQDIPALWSMENAASSLYELLLCGVITAVVLAIRARYVQNRRPCRLSATNFAGDSDEACS